MKRRIPIAIAAFVLILSFICACDPRGPLTEEDLQEMYEELREDIQAGKPWIHKERAVFFHEDKAIEDNHDFIQYCVTEVFVNTEKEQFEDESGIWFSSRRYCKDYEVKCSIPLEYNGVNYVITEVVAAKYYKRAGYKIWLYYTNETTGAANYIEASLG